MSHPGKKNESTVNLEQRLSRSGDLRNAYLSGRSFGRAAIEHLMNEIQHREHLLREMRYSDPKGLLVEWFDAGITSIRNPATGRH